MDCDSSPMDVSLLPPAPSTSHLEPDDWDWEILPEKKRRHEVEIVGGKKAVFHPIYAFGTAAIRGDKALTSNTVAYWEVRMGQNLFGTSVMFGVGTADSGLTHRNAFTDLLGKDEHSYGLNHHGIAYHDGLGARVTEPLPVNCCIVGVLFDGPQQSISYFVDGLYIGTPFKYIDVSKPMYPMVSSTAQQSQFILASQRCSVQTPSLLQLAIDKVHNLSRSHCQSLPLPSHLLQILIRKERARRGPLRKRGPTSPRSSTSSRISKPSLINIPLRLPRYGFGVENDQ